MITEFIKSNYENALKLQLGIKQDSVMIQSIQTNTLNSDIVKGWMTNYRLFQGIPGKIRNEVSKKFVEFSRDSYKEEAIDIEAEFYRLLARLYETHPIKWLSASSKLLWCMYPNQVVIYDSFVERSISVLQCLDENLAKLPRIKGIPNVNEKDDLKLIVEYYSNYQKLIKTLMNTNQETLDLLKKKYKSTYEYDLRILDKILWLMGNAGSEFSLNKIECK